MRNLIKKILKEDYNQKSEIGVGDVYHIPLIGFFLMVTDIECDDNNEGDKKRETTTWGEVTYYDNGCTIKYRRSLDGGKTWEKEIAEIESGWLKFLIRHDYWKLILKGGTKFFDEVNESEEDGFEWAREIVRC